MDLLNDATTRAIEYSLRAEAERQKVTAHNIANVNTPGFRSSRLDFESDLSAAIDSRGRASTTLRAANTPQSLNGNDVALEEETVNLLESGLHYQALVQALNFQINVVRSAIGR